ncbi:RICIN domain-containing protein [Streptomyces sp. BI20]|uniref:RICIN domain-containing protein n=1 Tax=Streptomyces sp. BI20 TaxID=3403460 RepID=UPI003C73873F
MTTGGRPVLVRNAGTGLVLEVERGNRLRTGAPARPPGADQRWLLTPVHPGAGVYHLLRPEDGRRLDVAGASTEPGARVQLWRANGFGAQEWLVEEHLDQPGVVSLVATISGLPLDVDEEGRPRQAEESDSPTQGWHLDPLPE